MIPIDTPTSVPSMIPSDMPTSVPSMIPTDVPTSVPSYSPIKPSSSQVSFDAAFSATVSHATTSNMLSSTSFTAVEGEGLLGAGSNSILTADEEEVIIATQAAILQISDEFISIVSATLVSSYEVIIVINVDMPYDADVYASPHTMYTALTTTFVDAINDGDYAAELLSQATLAGTTNLMQVTISGGRITAGATSSLAVDSTYTDHKLYGLIILCVIPIAAVIYAKYATTNESGAGVTKEEVSDVTAV